MNNKSLYSIGKQRTLEALSSSIEDGTIVVYEGEIPIGNMVENPAEELRSLLSKHNINLADEIACQRSEHEAKFEQLAIPKASPIITGVAARRLIEEMKNPKDNSELFKRCRQSSKLFKHIVR